MATLVWFLVERVRMEFLALSIVSPPMSLVAVLAVFMVMRVPLPSLERSMFGLSWTKRAWHVVFRTCSDLEYLVAFGLSHHRAGLAV